MKLLIIAGPYEADRIRRAVVSAGFEAVAVEPGESLSGWITASRPDLIVLAPLIVNPDPTVALAKVRSVPRGRVPTFLVGDPDDEARMKGLADGFLVRPLSTADLIARVRTRLSAGSTGERRIPTGEVAIPAVTTDVSNVDFARAGTSKSGTPSGAKSLPTLRPLVSAADSVAPPVPRARPSEAGALFVKLAESIDAALDAEMQDVARSVGALRREVPPQGGRVTRARRPDDVFERTPMAPMTALAAAAALPHVEGEATAISTRASLDAYDELSDETRHKTVEVPRDVFAKMIAERLAAARGSAAVAGGSAPDDRGKLEDSDMAALMGRMHLQRWTGRLVLRRQGVQKVIAFERGVPVMATSSDAQDRMGELLVREGRLTAAQLTQASEGLPSAGRRLGGALVQAGLVKASELPALVRRHFEELIHSAFAWEDGEWTLGPEQPPEAETVRLHGHPAALILEGIRRKYTPPRLLRCLGGGGQIFRLPASAATSDVLTQLGLFHEERSIVPLFDGVRTLDEVRAAAQARDEVVCGVAWALSVLGQLDRIEPLPAVTTPPAAAANGATDAAHARERARDQAIDRARILARHALVEEGDYFQVLGLARTASPHEVRRAHDGLMTEFAPTALDPALVAELGAELRAIRAVLDEALRVLGEPGLRERYQTHLPGPPPRSAARPAAGSAVESPE